MTRVLYALLGLAYFNISSEFEPAWTSVSALNLVFVIYLVANAAFLLHLREHEHTLWRIRAGLTLDVIMVTLCVLNDPYAIPPSALAYLMVVLGNGMRFGLVIFRESLGLSIAAFGFATWARTVYMGWPVTTGSTFFVVFWLAIVLYAYRLTRRIDEQRRALDLRSRLDSLTGLLNRHGLGLAAEDAFERVRTGAGVTAMYLDLDRFKQVNDTYGHAVGDWVLTEFGTLLETVADGNLAARIGGDEFVLLANDLPRDKAQDIADKLRLAVMSWCERNRIHFGVTVGIAQAPDDGADLASLLKRADQALYRAKQGEPVTA